MPRYTRENELARQAAMWGYENMVRDAGYSLIAGVDEAGRGPLAGPVYAAAVILKEGAVIDGINDSKKLSEKKREELFEVIKENSVAYSVFSISEEVIDRVNILNATYMAMNGAVDGLKPAADFVMIDGNSIRGMQTTNMTIVGGDSKSISIAAASILAKVSRDRYITKMAELYPQYGFEKHKGYGTSKHYEAILKYGLSPIHRRSFLKRFLGEHK